MDTHAHIFFPEIFLKNLVKQTLDLLHVAILFNCGLSVEGEIQFHGDL